MTCWQNYKFSKWQVDKNACWHVDKMTRCKLDLFTCWQVVNIISCQNDKLTRWQYDKITSWQVYKLTFWHVDYVSNYFIAALYFCSATRDIHSNIARELRGNAEGGWCWDALEEGGNGVQVINDHGDDDDGVGLPAHSQPPALLSRPQWLPGEKDENDKFSSCPWRSRILVLVLQKNGGGVVKTDLELFHKFILMPYLQPCDDDQRKWRQLDDLDEDNGQDHGGQVQVTGNMTWCNL